MSYAEAKKCFEKNLSMLVEGNEGPQVWNVHSGLFHLAEAIETDMRRMEKRIEELSARLDNNVEEE
jgi:hypothetical protein